MTVARSAQTTVDVVLSASTLKARAASVVLDVVTTAGAPAAAGGGSGKGLAVAGQVLQTG